MSPPGVPTVVYVHGAGNKPPRDNLKLAWDLDPFGRDMGQRTRMAHYADLLHARPGAIGADACTPDEALAGLGLGDGATSADGDRALAGAEAELLAGLTPQGQQLALIRKSMVRGQAAAPGAAQRSRVQAASIGLVRRWVRG
jgi:hypothetical protein